MSSTNVDSNDFWNLRPASVVMLKLLFRHIPKVLVRRSQQRMFMYSFCCERTAEAGKFPERTMNGTRMNPRGASTFAAVWNGILGFHSNSVNSR
jgi:hypothetical protein